MKITPLPELTPILKQLRLSGLLDSLDARNREAIEKTHLPKSWPWSFRTKPAP